LILIITRYHRPRKPGPINQVDLPARKNNDPTKDSAVLTLHHENLKTLRCGAKKQDASGRLRLNRNDGHIGILRIHKGRPGKLRLVASENLYRNLPAVDELIGEFVGVLPYPLLVEAARSALAEARKRITAGREPDVSSLIKDRVRAIERSAGIKVINATGVLLHTNLGRASWSQEAIKRAALAASSPSNLEIDIDSGERIRRGAYVTDLLRSLTSADDSLVVNNNASALILTLAATSSGLAVAVARGELIEIGGSYRLPDVMETSGSRLIEIGTTNRSRIGDYQTALQLYRSGAILKVHPSNFRVEGFTAEPDVAELATLAHTHNVPLIYDIGSGLLDADAPWIDGPAPEWLRREPAVRQTLAAGTDLVTFSGDKMLGGPQAGIIVGTAAYMEAIRNHPLTRALRVDGATYAALAATLEAYMDHRVEEIPFWRQALMDSEVLQDRSEAVATTLGAVVIDGYSAIGAGSVPGMTIASPVIRIDGRDDLYEKLLALDTPVLARREDGALLIDLRAVEPTDDEAIVKAISACL
jgi:L-seryl-tRNA(Ser) seleniumtransferase